ncbi:neuronal acetylcholine receptor subunit alpha-10 isoform X1 [Hydra vulgaris]|uniref:neuronal acetylcholine receptor subunit alpha-10 isoform X1 n=1 Tax=Hydra vulgaris TaxID=6087 RepID=UPI001F5F59BB|nr:neuronal acetylcholine receptor subunit alpha-10-like isoform X1 [Hydra vulgaris]
MLIFIGFCNGAYTHLCEVVFVSIFVFVVVFCHKNEEKLHQDLFANYNPAVRPVVNDSDTVNVTFGLMLCQLVDVQERNQLLVISTVISQKWKNPYLTWDPEKYSNITEIRVDPAKVWKPDIVLYNNVAEDRLFAENFGTLKSRVIVDNTGYTTWLTPLILSSNCDMNLKYFPFDTQKCPLKFGSWTHNMHRLNIINDRDSAILDKFANHTEWYLVSAKAIRKEEMYICCPEVYPDVTYTIELRRRSLFYVCNLIFPLVIISLLPILSFVLPSDSGERISLVIALLLSLTVYSMIVSSIIPDTSDSVPLVSIFYLSVFFEMVVMIVILCYIMTLHHKAACDPPMPNWMRKFILNWLANLLKIHKNNQDSPLPTGDNSKSSNLLVIDYNSLIYQSNCTLTSISKLEDFCFEKIESRIEKKTPDSSTIQNIKTTQEEISSNIVKTLAKMDCFTEEIHRNELKVKLINEWKIVAITLDKCAFFGFAVLYVLTIVGCFSLSPGYKS